MSGWVQNDGIAAVVAALIELDVRPEERVLVLILDGPGFAEIFLGVMRQGAVPLTVNPALSAGEIRSVAAQTGARLVAVAATRLGELTDQEAGPSILLDGPHGPWAAILRLI
ncbi:MAG: AMP-binding protein [Pseudonocardiaceae bacterium]